MDMEEFDWEKIKEEMVQRWDYVIESIRRRIIPEEPGEVSEVEIDDDEVAEFIREKVKEDITPELWGYISFNILEAQWTEERYKPYIRAGVWAYLVTVKWGEEVVIISGDEQLESNIASFYFKKVLDFDKMLEFIAARLYSTEGKEVDPDVFEIVEITPRIPLKVRVEIDRRPVSIEEALEMLNEYPEV